MRKFFCLSALLMALAACSSGGDDPGVRAGQVAKAYYDALLKGDYAQYVDGFYQPDSIPAGYREQLVANAKMFMRQQQDERRGMKEVRVVTAKADTARHVASVFLSVVYGDSTSEEIVVPMVEHRGVWYLK